MLKFLFKYCFILLILAVSCDSSEPVEIKANYKEINDVLDTIEPKINFSPLTSRAIYTSMSSLIKGTPKFKMPTSFVSDSSGFQNYIEEAGIASVYATWSDLMKMKTMKKNADYRLKNATKMLWSSTQIEKNESTSLENNSEELSTFLVNNSNYKAYFEAISWLENLYFTIQLQDNIQQKTAYNTVLLKQLKNGNDLLSFLYDYQDYRPISVFSQEILEVVDCKNFEMNVTQLKEVVIDCRKRIYQLN